LSFPDAAFSPPIILFFLTFLLFAQYVYAFSGAFDTSRNIFHGCPAEGFAAAKSKADPDLNRLKIHLKRF